MSLFRIVWKNLAQRRLSSLLTMLSIALGVGVTVGILALKEQGRAGFSQGAFGIDLVVGAKGSRLQLVLNTIYHLDQATGTIPFSLYERLSKDRRVSKAAPMAVGDFYKGHRIIGTTDRFLREFEAGPGQKYELAEGRLFEVDEAYVRHLLEEHDHHGHDHGSRPFEAVAGSQAASATGLKAGGTFTAQHGSDYGDVHEEQWTVVGVLKPTGTANDRAIFINLDSFFHIAGHQKEESTKGHISTIVLKTRGARAAQDLEWELAKGTEAMGVVPAAVVVELFDMISQVDVLLLAVSILVVIVAGVSILVALYNSLAERRRPIAIMRALGARRGTIFSVIVMESLALCIAGGILGMAAGHGLTGVAAGILRTSAGILISPWVVSPMELWILAGLVVLGVIVGLLPAWKAYRTDIADGLNPTI